MFSSITHRVTLLIVLHLVCMNLIAADYYWVGNSGNWHDPTNWATTSGGSLFHDQPPGENDDVYFDENSFSGIGVDTVLIPGQTSAVVRALDMSAVNVPHCIRFEYWSVLEFHREFELNPLIDFAIPENGFARIHFMGNAGSLAFESYGQLDKITFKTLGTGSLVPTDDTLRFKNLNTATGAVIYRDKRLEVGTNINANSNTLYVEGTEIIYGLEGRDTSIVATFNVGLGNLTGIDEETSIFGAASYSTFAVHTPFPTDSISLGDVYIDGACVHLGTGWSLRTRIRKLEIRGAAFLPAHGFIDTLILNPGNQYVIDPGLNPNPPSLNVRKIITRSNCEQPIYLNYRSYRLPLGLTNAADGILHLSSPNDQVLNDIIIEGINFRHEVDVPAYAGRWHVENGSILNSEGWDSYTPAPTRTLYRLSGSSEWYDPDYWSLSSGGAGGECVPGPTDLVVFDANSFSSSGDSLTTYKLQRFQVGDLDTAFFPLPLFCGEIDWRADALPATFVHPDLRVYGSATMQPSIDYQIKKTAFLGQGNHYLRSNGMVYRDVDIYAPDGHYFLEDSLLSQPLRWLTIDEANFSTQGHPIRFGAITGYSENPNYVFDLSNSDIHLTGRWRFANATDDLLYYKGCGNCFYTGLNLTNTTFTGYRSDAAIMLPNRPLECNIVFPDSTIRADILQMQYGEFQASPEINRIALAGNGLIRGNFFVDSLEYAPGRAYLHRAPRRVVVEEYFDARGTFCHPIHLGRWGNAVAPPKLALLPTATVLADYLEVDEVIGVDDTPIYLGPNSRMATPDQTPQGIAFAYQPGRRPFSLSPGFLGGDTILCTSDPPLALEPDEWYAPPSLDYAYRWYDGLTDTLRSITEPGTYDLALTFQDRAGHFCTMNDTIGVRIASDEPTDWFPPYEILDPVCAGDSNGLVTVFLPDSLDEYSLSGRQPDSGISGFAELPAGEFVLSVTGPLGCPVRDTFTLLAPPPLFTDLPSGLTRRAPEPLPITVNAGGGVSPYTFRWSANTPDSTTAGLSCPNCPSPVLTPPSTTRYGLRVTDAAGCVLDQSTLVAVTYDYGVYAPGAFSPNFDGNNDRLSIFGPDNGFTVEDYTVYNRWGQRIYALPSLPPNDPAAGWDGTIEGRPAPVGVYVLTYRLRWPDGTTVRQSRDVTLVR